MDKRFFEQAAREMIGGSIDAALMAKAVAMSQGEEAKAKAAYLTLRAEELQSADRARRLKNAALVAATATGTGTVLASKAAVSATQRVWPVLLKTTKVLLWIAVILIAASILLHMFLQKHIGSLASTGKFAAASSTRTVSTARSPGEFRPLGYSLGITRNQQNAQYNAMLDELERKYPPLNPNSRQFSQSTVSRLESLVSAFEHQGLAGPVALQKAALQITNIRVLIPRSSADISSQATPRGQSSKPTKSSSSTIDYENPHNRECWLQYQRRISGIPQNIPLGEFAKIDDEAKGKLAKCVR